MHEKGDNGDIGDMAMRPGVNDLTGRVIQCIIDVHQTLGPGFVESVYRQALLIEFRKRGIAAESEKLVLIHYDGHVVGRHRLDIIVEGELVVELKTVDALSKAHYAQVRSYLKATGLSIALLVNFAEHHADFRRVQSQ